LAYKKNESGKRPWGYWRVDEVGDGFVKKTIVVDVGASLSLQSHEHRSEKWEIISGIAEVTIEEVILRLTTGETAEIPARIKHRLKNVGEKLLTIKETQTGAILDEDDITRYEDMYGRLDMQKDNIK
jgi:mannose-6-phosphate isomerase-like protein (cupin superfamily)